ncbi:MAG: site-specific DNA-methyltransferase [Cellvibrionales bacterium]|nr:site-specific DNA-methyltransferase [Cellvibrionales bacterium]
MNATSQKNRLYYGDCLTIMQGMEAASVDLIYLDPPFNSKRDYNAIYKDETGLPLPDQIENFRDIWKMDVERVNAVRNLPVLMREHGIDDRAAEFCRLYMEALDKTQPAMLAYLSYMAERLIMMRGLLKSTGSIYLHCDPTASHYLKIIMDVIFGQGNFLNEIIWSYRTGGVSKRWFGRKHDVLLYYARSKGSHVFHVHKERSYSTSAPPGFKEIKKHQDEHGRWYTMASMRDVWELNAIGRSSKERLGYATQKPLVLLERIIQASSNEGDLVLDPFCGCATTIEAAHRLSRHWIGIDIAIHAVKRVSRLRLTERLRLAAGKDYRIEGIPLTLEGAQDLWERDKYHFQKWAVEQTDGFVTGKRTADGGIDGRIYFASKLGDKTLSSMILEVKGGKNVGIDVVRNLRAAMDREKAPMAGLILLHDLGERKLDNFRREMGAAGSLEVNGINYARIQLLTVADILDGRKFKTPGRVAGQSATQFSAPVSTPLDK